MPGHHPPTTEPLRFGVFEINLSARELREYGVRVKLQDQPFAVPLMKVTVRVSGCRSGKVRA